jgi:hypothetical protein
MQNHDHWRISATGTLNGQAALNPHRFLEFTFRQGLKDKGRRRRKTRQQRRRGIEDRPSD